MVNNARNPQAENLFRARYKGHPNLMTPSIWSRRMIAKGKLAVELSSGKGIQPGTELWGVTVLYAYDIHRRLGLSHAFGTRHDAEAYIQALRHWEEPVEAEEDAQ